MSANKGFSMDREPLRALAHAQGQLIHSHRDMLLFFALDALTCITEAPQGAALEAFCPKAFATARAFAPYLKDIDKRQALFEWDVNAALRDCSAALEEFAAACRNAGGNPEDNAAHERLARLAETTFDYLDMAADIRRTDLAGTFRRAAKINPYTSAAFAAAYMQRIGDDLAQRAKPGSASASMVADLAKGRRGLEYYLPESVGAIQQIAPEKIGRLYELMDRLSETANLAREAGKTALREDASDARLAQATHFLFVTAAVYDWRQFRQPQTANDPQKPPPHGNILQFKAR